MNKIDLSRSLGYLSDDIIAEAIASKSAKTARRKPYFARYAAIAASCAAVVLMAVFIGRNGRQDMPVRPPHSGDVTVSQGITSSESQPTAPPIISEPPITSVSDTSRSTTVNTDANGEEALDGLDYVLELDEEPIYDNVEIIPEESPTGEAQSYEELATNDLPYRNNLCFIAFEIKSVYSAEEETEIIGENRSATLYKAHVYYDFLSESECDYYINIYHAGDQISQYYGCPGYSVGHKYAAAVSGNETWVVANSKLEFSIHTINGVEFAYHHCAEEIKLTGDYANLDLEMADTERSVITTTKNNPVLYTQKSTVKSLGSFIRYDWSNRGLVGTKKSNE